MRRISLGLQNYRPLRKPDRLLPLPSTVQKDVFLSALLEMPTTVHPRRSPLEWAGSVAIHVVILAALIIVPLYTTRTIHLKEYEETPLVPPPPPPPPAPSPTMAASAPRVMHRRPRFSYTAPKLTIPKSIPRKVSQGSISLTTVPDLSGVAGGVPGGVTQGEIGGLAGGTLGGTGTASPPPPPPPPPPLPPLQPRPSRRIVRVDSKFKAPRQILSQNPEYPPLARQAHISGTVVVDALIDEHGNVVQAHAVSGPPLLIPAAIKAVLQWKYEPTFLNGQPVSVELQVEVRFKT